MNARCGLGSPDSFRQFPLRAITHSGGRRPRCRPKRQSPCLGPLQALSSQVCIANHGVSVSSNTPGSLYTRRRAASLMETYAVANGNICPAGRQRKSFNSSCNSDSNGIFWFIFFFPDHYRFFASQNMDRSFAISPFRVDEEGFVNCDTSKGQPIVPDPSKEPIMVLEQYLQPGVNYFISE